MLARAGRVRALPSARVSGTDDVETDALVRVDLPRGLASSTSPRLIYHREPRGPTTDHSSSIDIEALS
jgi:hypothetical protein